MGQSFNGIHDKAPFVRLGDVLTNQTPPKVVIPSRGSMLFARDVSDEAKQP